MEELARHRHAERTAEMSPSAFPLAEIDRLPRHKRNILAPVCRVYSIQHGLQATLLVQHSRQQLGQLIRARRFEHPSGQALRLQSLEFVFLRVAAQYHYRHS